MVGPFRGFFSFLLQSLMVGPIRGSFSFCQQWIWFVSLFCGMKFPGSTEAVHL